jgi:hypothetical protein
VAGREESQTIWNIRDKPARVSAEAKLDIAGNVYAVFDPPFPLDVLSCMATVQPRPDIRLDKLLWEVAKWPP